MAGWIRFFSRTTSHIRLFGDEHANREFRMSPVDRTGVGRRSMHLEWLESRTLLAASPIGQESIFESTDSSPPADLLPIAPVHPDPPSDSGAGASGPVANLIHHWKLDETTGLTAIVSVGGADGTLANMTGTEWTAGLHDGGLAFDGTHDYITVGQVASLQLSGPITIAAWVNVHDTFPQWGGIAGWVHDTGQTESGYSLTTMDGGGFAFGLKTEDGGMTYLADYGHTTHTWYHVAGTYDGTSRHKRQPVPLPDSAAPARSGSERAPAGTGLRIGSGPSIRS